MKESCRVGRESQCAVADRRGRKSQSQLRRKRVAVADREERKKERKKESRSIQSQLVNLSEVEGKYKFS